MFLLMFVKISITDSCIDMTISTPETTKVQFNHVTKGEAKQHGLGRKGEAKQHGLDNYWLQLCF